MKLWIFSDLHLEFGSRFNVDPPSDADIAICAGDVLTNGVVPSLRWLGERLSHRIPVVFVGGNHEYYNGSISEGIAAARAVSDYPNLHYLENGQVEIDGITFVGGTLWSDFRLSGFKPEVAMFHAERDMNDYRKIKLSKTPYVKFRPIYAYRKHVETRDFIASELRRLRGQKVVVVTHHAPSVRSIEESFRFDPISASYASDLEELIFETGPALWVHGHVHHRNDYMLDACRVISNPRGYPGQQTGFDPGLTVEISTDVGSMASALANNSEADVGADMVRKRLVGPMVSADEMRDRVDKMIVRSRNH
ncbi:metallophosphoesterase [Rhizobium sp. S152]|uniref:metallophosphoesterase n=1 Tax=Rhizobium sp. S152 TaxID=3055038 RepID=UPI0025A97C04|nr:metallophosphoesterase [Rhizobium sp. S152]MDM9628562.1 metallophosphoesterase [Rhizobium sp. S152]